MRSYLPLGTGALLIAVASVLISYGAFGQDAPKPAAEPQSAANMPKGIPPRATPGDYLSHAQAGSITIAAEFDRHSVPTPEATLTTEDFVAVEVGIFGPPGAHLIISYSDFSLRINRKKSPLPAEQFAAVFRNLRDPDYSPPELEEAKASKAGSFGAGGGGAQGDLGSTPPPVHIPPELERAMELKVQNAALPEGDRALPVAGLIFFKYGGLPRGIHSVQLLYTGAAGKTIVALQP